jgi:hypothetical protein
MAGALPGRPARPDAGRGRGSRGAVRANGQPAFGCYLQEAPAAVFRANGMIVLTLEGDRISALTRFKDNGNLARFGLPPVHA